MEIAEGNDTREAVLDLAQQLAQTRGYNGFSYRDLAEKIGIRAPSIHYYFPAKSDLGATMAGEQESLLENMAQAARVTPRSTALADHIARLSGVSPVRMEKVNGETQLEGDWFPEFVNHYDFE